MSGTDLPEGTVLITDHQTQGRGQRGNTWDSGQGLNLTFSLLLRPRFLAVRDQFQLSMAVALGIAEGLGEQVPSGITLKWPNDIMSEGKKVGGVLIENQSQGPQLSVAIVGIGINVNQRELPHPGAGSLIQVLGRETPLQEILHTLLTAIEARYLQLRSGAHAIIQNDYHARLHRVGVPQTFEAEGKSFTGIIRGVDESGRLRVQEGDEERVFALKEIRMVN